MRLTVDVISETNFRRKFQRELIYKKSKLDDFVISRAHYLRQIPISAAREIKNEFANLTGELNHDQAETKEA